MGIGEMMNNMGSLGGGCQHDWKSFNDTKLKNTGFMGFYCTRRLAMAKKKIEYMGEQK